MKNLKQSQHYNRLKEIIENDKNNLLDFIRIKGMIFNFYFKYGCLKQKDELEKLIEDIEKKRTRVFV